MAEVMVMGLVLLVIGSRGRLIYAVVKRIIR